MTVFTFCANVGAGIAMFSGLDLLMSYFGFQGVYYAIHSFHNLLMILETYQDVYRTLFQFAALPVFETNQGAIELCFSLHLYHLLLYWKKFRKDDWLHHGLMIGLALPLGMLVPAGPLMGYNLFFTTGLPGCIDYAALFLVRNGWLDRLAEKQLNTELNVWIRSPGCMSHATYVLASVGLFPGHWMQKVVSLIPAGLTFWNGQYFMKQVVADYSVQNLGRASSHAVTRCM